MPGVPLLLSEREEIRVALEADPDVSFAEVARRIGRDRSTVSREVARNGGREAYRAAAAQGRAEQRRKRPRRWCLCADEALRERVTNELRAGRSPAAIAADLRAEGLALCHETICSAVYGGRLEVRARECLRRRRPRRRGRQARHASARPALPNISARPAAVNDRSELGHWEGDLIVGANNRSATLTLIERVTRFGRLIDLPEGYHAEAVLAAFLEAFESVPAPLRRSLTLDQGGEWAAWPALADAYGLDLWFCDPHSPWQRGAIENFNGHVRFWLPRGRRLDVVGPDELGRIEGAVNGQRRRLLGWSSPAQLWDTAVAAAA